MACWPKAPELVGAADPIQPLAGIHHITAITGDALGNVDFYARVMGLRLVKKTVNQDDPGVYHLFYADEKGSPGADLTFFEYPGLPPGRAGAGMVHRIVWRVSSEAALDFWAGRLSGEGISYRRVGAALLFQDPEGLGLELMVDDSSDQPLIAESPGVPADMALRGFAGVRAFATRPQQSQGFLEEAVGFQALAGDRYLAGDGSRSSFYVYDAPELPPLGGAGTVHHVAWACTIDEQPAWRQRVAAAGGSPTPIIDRYYFRSIYFREPSGVLFEIATVGPGFATDEDPEHLGERVSLPPTFEHLRDQVERTLTPLPNPRAGRVSS